jgi:hypothetical protein
MPWSESVAKIAVSSAKVAVVVSGEVGRSAVYRRYRKGPRTLLWGTPAFTGKSSVYCCATLTWNVWPVGGI